MMLTYYFGAFLIVWLVIISFFLYKIRAHYYHLISRTKKGSIDEILEVLMGKDDLFTQEIKQVKKSVEQINDESKFHFQKIGFLRFNPFERVGGQQSFIIALLDKENSGIILDFLYTREGIRVYAKKVKKGVSEEYGLSNEEKEVIKKAK